MYSKKQKFSTHHLVIISLLSAVAYVTMLVGRVPMIVDFLKYDPKDVVIMLSGLAFGPGVTILMSLIISFIEMITVSADGPIGFLMNVLSTVAYVTPAIIIYRKNYTTKNLVIGLAVGTILTTIVMTGWNYIITPFYLQIPRETVVGMLLPIIIPSNLIKYSINSGIVILIQKPILRIFKRSNLITREIKNQKSSIYILGAILIVSSVALVFLLRNM